MVKGVKVDWQESSEELNSFTRKRYIPNGVPDCKPSGS